VKRIQVIVSVFVVASCLAPCTAANPAASTPAPVKSPAPAKTKAPAPNAAAREAARQATLKMLAPADEYFGPLKMSILGIRNTTRDLGLRYDVNHDIASQTLASAALTESSIRDWEHKYPQDHGIARAVYYLQRLYDKVLTEQGRAKADATAKWLFSKYGRSPQAKQLRKVLASEPVIPLPSPTPVPSAVPTATATPTYNSAFGSPYPSMFAPSPSPGPATPAALPAVSTSAPPSPIASLLPAPRASPTPH
jgi:hypothetical protein